MKAWKCVWPLAGIVLAPTSASMGKATCWRAAVASKPSAHFPAAVSLSPNTMTLEPPFLPLGQIYPAITSYSRNASPSRKPHCLGKLTADLEGLGWWSSPES